MAIEPSTTDVRPLQPSETNLTTERDNYNTEAPPTSYPAPSPGAVDGAYNRIPTGHQPSTPEHPSDDSDSEGHTVTTTHTPQALALQWNICGLSTRHAELELLIKTHRPFVIALQEVQTRQGHARLENGGYDWEFAFPPGPVSKNGAALGVDKEIPHEFLQVDSSLQVVAARVEWPIQATFVSIYVSKNDGKSSLCGVLEKLVKQLPNPVVLLGDWNAHSDLWGSSTLDERGRAIEEFVSANQLIVLNSGKHTRVDFNDGHTSAIDLSIVSEPLARRLTWDVLEDSHGSDHFPILIEDLDRRTAQERKRPRWKYDAADWKKFQEALHRPNTLSAEALEEALVSAAEASIPRTGTKVGRRAVHWWNPTVETAIRERRKALRKFRKRCKRNPNDPQKKELSDSFKSARREARKATKEAKSQSWTNFVTGISPELNTKEVWRRINTFRNGNRASVRRLITPDGMTDEPTEMANVLADQFYRVSADEALHPEHVQKRNSANLTVDHSKHDHDEYNCDFSVAELRWAINRGKGLSAGIDEIGYPMLRHLTGEMETYVLELFNQVWRAGTIPQRWKEGVTIPIPKASKDPSQPENLRPITLVSCVGKTMERMVNRRLTHLLESKGVLGDRQHGFRSGHGVDTYLADLEEEIESAIHEGKHTELVLLDLAKAYDTAWRAPVVASLSKWGIGGNMGRYMESFLADRTFRVAVGGALSSLRVLENGVPQGTVMAVTAFLIRMTEVEPFVPAGVTIKMYADDIVLVSSGAKEMELRRRMQKAVQAVETWTTLYGFQLSAAKSQLLHICRKNRHLELPDISTDDGPMETVKNARLLGVSLDSRFRFWKQMEVVRKSVESRNRALAVLGGHLAAGARTTLLMAQQAIVQSRLFFGWGTVSSASDSRRVRLEASYNAGIRSASGAFKSSPILAIMAESGVLPFRYQETVALVTRGTQIQALAEHGVERAIFTRARERFCSMTGSELPKVARVLRTSDRAWNQPTPTIDWRIHGMVRAGDNAAKVAAAFGEIAQEYQLDRKMFTDGSLMDGVVGAGVVEGSTKSSFRLPEQCSVFSAEALAIVKALESAPDDGRRTVVFSDSLSVLAAVEGGVSKHPWVQRIEELMSERSVVLVWIPGHTGITGNDAADEAAKQARQLEPSNLPVPRQDLLRWAQEKLRAAWNGEWVGYREIFLRRIKPTTTAGRDRRNQEEQRALTRLRIGHTRLTHGEIFKTGGKECTSCGIPLTVVHILLDCRRYAALRSKHQLDNNIGVVLSNDVNEEDKLLAFLRESGLYKEV